MTFPSAAEFFLRTALYVEHIVEGEDVWKLADIIYFQGAYDSYCVGCGREATFRGKQGGPPDVLNRARHRQLAKVVVGRMELPTAPHGVHTVSAECSRAGHVQRFVVLVHGRWVKTAESGKADTVFQKIGQHPSFGDLNLGKVKDYSDVLTKVQLGELSRAIGLASHDVGIGSYVYLRRVFEALVEEAHVLARKEDVGWDEESYGKLRMHERIAALKHHLPPFLTEHPQMYSLLSKGVHELSETECLNHFETLRIGVELILDEKKDLRRKQKKTQEAKAALSKAFEQSAKANDVA